MKKYFELLTIPVAVLLLIAYNYVAEWFGLFVFTWEMFGKVFVAFLMFLVSVGFIRIVYILMFPIMYKYFDLSFSNAKLAWNKMSEERRLYYSTALFVCLLSAFVRILSGL